MYQIDDNIMIEIRQFLMNYSKADYNYFDTQRIANILKRIEKEAIKIKGKGGNYGDSQQKNN